MSSHKPKAAELVYAIGTEAAQTVTEEERFMHSRDWKFDYALPDIKVAIEYQGGLFMKKGGHSNIAGQTRDWEKFNEAQIRGWLVICVNPKTIEDGTFEKQLRRAIKVRKGVIRYD